MTPETIRQLFAGFCGAERYRRFVKTFNETARPRGRLCYWQEELWLSFVTNHPSLAPLSFDELLPIFRLCHVHLSPLTDRKIPIIKDLHCILRKDDYEAFPYALEYSLDSPAFEGKNYLVVDDCEQCRKSREECQKRG